MSSFLTDKQKPKRRLGSNRVPHHQRYLILFRSLCCFFLFLYFFLLFALAFGQVKAEKRTLKTAPFKCPLLQASHSCLVIIPVIFLPLLFLLWPRDTEEGLKLPSIIKTLFALDTRKKKTSLSHTRSRTSGPPQPQEEEESSSWYAASPVPSLWSANNQEAIAWVNSVFLSSNERLIIHVANELKTAACVRSHSLTLFSMPRVLCPMSSASLCLFGSLFLNLRGSVNFLSLSRFSFYSLSFS